MLAFFAAMYIIEYHLHVPTISYLAFHHTHAYTCTHQFSLPLPAAVFSLCHVLILCSSVESDSMLVYQYSNSSFNLTFILTV